VGEGVGLFDGRVVGEGDAQEELVLFNAGGRDVATIFFYTLAWIVVHAIIQEYILDKFNKKLHLSKTKHSKLNDAGSVLPFYLLSVGFGIDLVNKNSTFPNLSKLWEEYPQSEMNFMVKFYFILQIAFWLHNFPELFFMKTRKEEYSNKISTYCLYLAFIVPAYIMSGSQVALLLLTIHYIPEAVLTFTRLLHYSGANDLAKHGFLLWAVLFILARLATISLTLLILGFGLTKLEVSSINLSTGNYNTQFMRIVWVAAIVLNQAWMCWNFIVFR
jgi:translocating chain-associated membrane protein 1